MSFTWPLVLIALAAIPVLVALYIDRDRRRVASQAAFGNPDLLPNMVDREPGRLRYLAPLIMLVALVFLIVGVARPHATVSVPREEATIVLAMDVSRSMKATDVEPTRLDAARTAAKTFLDEVPEKFRVGVVSFATPRGGRRCADRGSRARRDCPRHARARRGDGDRRCGRAVARRRAAAGGRRGDPAARRRAPLRRRARRRPGRARRGGEAGEAAGRSRVHGARRHSRRRRRGGADRWIPQDHPRAAESRDARAGRRHIGRSVLRGTRRRGARAGCTRSSGRGSARASRIARSPTSSLRSRARCSSPPRRSPLCCSGGFREGRANVVGARGGGSRPRGRCAGRWRERVRRDSWSAFPSPGRGWSCRRRPRSRGSASSSSSRARAAHVVGGLDARLSIRAIDVGFIGTLGSPVNPGITTSRSVVFLGTYVGRSADAATFRPFIGCMPVGGRRLARSDLGLAAPSREARHPPREDRPRPARGRRRSRSAVRSGERLVGGSHAFGFATRTPPSASLVAGVSGSQAISGRERRRPRARRRRARRRTRGRPGARAVREGST